MEQPEPTRRWKRLKKMWGDLLLLAIVATMIGCAVYILLTDMADKPAWLLVPVTTIYTVLTLFMAAAAFQSAQAANRSVEVMERTLEEQRLSRQASFAAVLTFRDGFVYHTRSDGTAQVKLHNTFRQPVVELCVKIWTMEADRQHDRKPKYSSMLESQPQHFQQDDLDINLELFPSTLPESERVRIGDAALAHFKAINGGRTPQNALCLMSYMDRSSIVLKHLVYELTVE